MATVKFTIVDANDYLSKKQAENPELSADWAKLEEYYNKKLWHQLTIKLQSFVKHPTLKAGDNLIQLYNNFLTVFENKINPLSLVEIVSHIIQQFDDKKEAIAFLEKVETKVKINDEALALCKILQGEIYLVNLKDHEATAKIIDELENTLGDADGVTPVHGRYYRLASEYYSCSQGPLDRYYRATLRYLGCSGGGAQLSLQERQKCALRLTVAAVLSTTIYDLGELLAHPIMESLEGTSEVWGLELLRAVASGDIVAYEKLKPKVTPDLIKADSQLRKKISILSLMELAFNRSSSQRSLTFLQIMAETRVTAPDVEMLVMKAMAEKLIRGHIDQVNQTVTITWVRARALGRAGAGALARRLDAWCAAADEAALVLTHSAPDLLTA